MRGVRTMTLGLHGGWMRATIGEQRKNEKGRGRWDLARVTQGNRPMGAAARWNRPAPRSLGALADGSLACCGCGGGRFLLLGLRGVGLWGVRLRGRLRIAAFGLVAGGRALAGAVTLGPLVVRDVEPGTLEHDSNRLNDPAQRA